MKPYRRSGFATYTAIALMGLIAVMLVAVTMCFAADARRTRSQRDEAQLRQLLTAGALAAMTQIDHPSPTTHAAEIALPADLTGKLTCTLSRDDADHVIAVIHAQQGKRKMEQTIHLERRDGKWRAEAATLGEGEAPAEPRSPAK